MARRFFYVCAGLLMLAIAYHLGATSATAQASAVIGGIGCSPGSLTPNISLVVNRVVYRGTGNQYAFQMLPPLPPIPGTSPVVALDASCCGFALLENGDVWAGGGPTWSYVGNVLSGATTAAQKSWGQVKAKYHN
jgi:hypothetical protein